MKKAAVLLMVAALATAAQAALIDDFESYGVGAIRDGVTNGVWTAIENTSVATINSEDGTTAANQYLQNGWSGGGRGTYRGIDAIAEGSTATLFLQILAFSNSQDTSFGLSDIADHTTANWNNFELQMVLTDGADADHVKLWGRGGTASMQIELNRWYNIWAVLDQATDTYDMYVNTGGDATAADLLEAGVPFRNGTVDDLVSFLVLTNWRNQAFRIDNIGMAGGTDLTAVPEPAAMAILALGGLFLRRRK